VHTVPLLQRIVRFWTGPFDTRPLGLMRITLGMALVFATLDVAPVLRDLLSDDGVLPRSALLGVVRGARFSIFDAAGPLWATVLLYCATVLTTLAFTVGLHTRVATVASFVFVTGLHERNVAVFDGADNVVRVLLFFLMFAPAGDHYSLDALGRSPGESAPLRSAFTVRLVQLQFCWVYLGSALGKLSGPTWRNGTALHYALQLEHSFTRRLGYALADSRPIVVSGTYFTLAFETLFVCLVFSPVCNRGARGAAIILGTMLHAGIALTMRVGNFSYLMIACYPLFFEPEWATRVVRYVEPRLPLAALRRYAPEAVAKELNLSAVSRGVLRVLGAGLFLSAVWFSLPKSFRPTVPPPPARVQSTLQALELWQAWDMFAPNPIQADFYLRGTGKLKDGTSVDVLHGLGGGPLPPEEPRFFFTRWTKFLANLTYAGSDQLLPFSGFICRKWNQADRPAAEAPLSTFKIYRAERPSAPLGAPPNGYNFRLIWEHHCL
jgi:hypothetical protein